MDQLIRMEPSNRTAFLEGLEAIEEAYSEAAQSGSSEAPGAEDEVDYHYVCFIKSSDRLYELDGDRDGPVDRGQLAKGEDILSGKGLEAVRRYIDGEKDGMFGLLAVVSSSGA